MTVSHLYMQRKHICLYVIHTAFCLSLLFFQLVSVKLCRARSDLAQDSLSVLDAYTRNPSATNCSCHSEETHQLIKDPLISEHKMKSEK